MKPVFDEKCLFILVSLSTYIQCINAQACSKNLTNTVAYDGASASFGRMDNNQSVQWQYSPASNGFSPLLTITDYDDVVTSNLSSAFQVSTSELRIITSSAQPERNMSYPTAGLYTLNYANPNCTTAANLIVIRSKPLCSYDASDANNVTLSCNVEYAASNTQWIRPVITWIKNGTVVHQDKLSSSQLDFYWKNSKSRIGIGSGDATAYECQLTFDLSSPEPSDYVTRISPTFIACCYIKNPFAENCPAKLANIVVYEGSPASFKHSNNGQPAQWQIFSSSDALIPLRNITGYNGILDATLSSSYALNSTDLTILSSTVDLQGSPQYSTAGLYILTYTQTSCVSSANLIVIRSGPLCSLNASNPATATLSCRVDYIACGVEPNVPIFTWKSGTSIFPQQISNTSFIYAPFGYLKRIESRIRIGINDATRYECQLTFSPTSQERYNFVTKTPPDFTASCFVSTSDISTNPTFGPKAGGTVLTIVNNIAAQTVSAVYIGDNLRAEYHNSSGQTVFVKTPKIESEILINQPLPIILTISSISNITTGKYFTYKPNPRIDDVRPRELFISGGNALSISGNSFDSVAQPLVRAAVIITNNSIVTYYKESFESCQPPTENGTRMVCISPPIYIRQDFLLYLFNQTDPVYSRRKRESFFDYPWQREDRHVLQSGSFSAIRSKRSDSIKSIMTNQSYALPDSQELLVIYLGIVFDGLDKYKNNSLRDRGENMAVKFEPIIKCDIDKIVQSTDMVTIQGTGFMKCCTKENYKIRIGKDFYNITDLTDNALTFYPPENKPQQTMDDTLYCGDNLAIYVDVISKTWYCSCLKYPDGDSSAKLIIIVVTTTVGGSLVIIVVIIAISVNVRSKQKAKTLPNEFKQAQRSTLYAPPRHMTSKLEPENPRAGHGDMEGPTKTAGPAYYSKEIKNAHLAFKPAAFGLNYIPKRGSNEYLRPAEELEYPN